ISVSRLAEQHSVDLSEADRHVVIGVVAVRKFVAHSKTQGQVGPELHAVLHKPGAHPNPERNRRRRLGHLERGGPALHEAQQRGEVHLPISSTLPGALKPFQPASQGDRMDPLRNANGVLIGEDVIYIELVVAGVRSGTGGSHESGALRATDVDLSRRFSDGERSYSGSRDGEELKVVG